MVIWFPWPFDHVLLPVFSGVAPTVSGRWLLIGLALLVVSFLLESLVPAIQEWLHRRATRSPEPFDVKE
jgi:hypothetical protein